MQSLDTNVLFYAINRDCPEHEPCRQLIEQALDSPSDWVVADQVWFELYRLLRNPKALTRPLSADQAAETVAWYGDKSGWERCAWNTAHMNKLHALWSDDGFAPRRTFDAVLAITLIAHGVTTLYTRNRKDFERAGFAEVCDPVTN